MLPIHTNFNPRTIHAGMEPAELDSARHEAAVRDVAAEFEAVLAATLLKEGLHSGREENEDGGESSMFKDIAYEQIAYAVGRQGILGIADEIVTNMNRNINSGHHDQQPK